MPCRNFRPRPPASGYSHRHGSACSPGQTILPGRDRARVRRPASTGRLSWKQDQPEPVVVVRVVRGVVVAVGRPAVPGVVFPAAVAQHPVGASGRDPKSFNHMAAETDRIRQTGKIDQRRMERKKTRLRMRRRLHLKSRMLDLNKFTTESTEDTEEFFSVPSVLSVVYHFFRPINTNDTALRGHQSAVVLAAFAGRRTWHPGSGGGSGIRREGWRQTELRPLYQPASGPYPPPAPAPRQSACGYTDAKDHG